MRTVLPGPTVNVLFLQSSLVFFLCCGISFFSSSRAFCQNKPQKFKTIHVKLKEDFLPRQGLSSRSGRTGIMKLDKVSEKHAALSIERIFPDAGMYEEAHRAFGLHLWYEIRFSKGTQLKEAIAEYKKLEYFQKVEECKEYSTGVLDVSDSPTLPSGANDPLFGNQWHYNNTGQGGGTPGVDINLLSAWKTETGSPNVIVAVIDGGINFKHPDLQAARWTNSDEIADNKIDDDHNGYVDDIHGYGFGDGTPAIWADGHATHVAGTIGAVSNNGIGVSGIAGGSGTGDGVRLMSCAAFGSFGVGGFEAAMVYAADNGAVISQNSWGGGSSAIESAIDYFISRAGYDNSQNNFSLDIQTGPMAGGIVIFAAGNSNSSSIYYGYPATYEKVIAVASTDRNDVKSSFSNFGAWVDISAPGSQVYSTYGQQYEIMSGTSMACPHVSGVAALVVSRLQRNGLKPAEVWNRLRLSARDISLSNPGMIGKLGAGRIDASVALKEPDAIAPAAITDLDATDIHFSSVNLTWTATGADNNVGQAAEFDIRYSTGPINESNFATADRLLSPPLPPPSGEPVNFLVDKLTSGTTYYFALKVKDLFNNASGLSNVVEITTKTLPAPFLVTTQFSEVVRTGAVLSREVVVRNDGGDDLVLRLAVPEITRAPVGHLTGEKGRLFAVNVNNSRFEELNPESGAILNSIPMPVQSTKAKEGLAFDGENLFYAQSDKVYKIDPGTGEVIRTFLIPNVSATRGLAWSGRYLYASVATTQGPYRLFEIDADNGAIVKTIDGVPSELTFTGGRGMLLTCGSGDLQEIDVTTGNVNRTISVGGSPRGLAYSGTMDVVFVSDESVIRAIHPDSGNTLYTLPYPTSTALAADEYMLRWVNTGGQVVTIPSGATGSIPISFVATELPSGKWTGTTRVLPVNINTTPLTVPLSLTVESASDIETVKEIDFGIQFLVSPISITIPIENRGFSQLSISDIQSSDARVTSSLTSLALGAGEKSTMTVTVSPTGLGVIEATIIFTSSDPDEPTVTVPVHVEILAAPSIAVGPESLAATLLTGEKTSLTFTTHNTGGSVLHWDVNIAGINSPGFGQSSLDQTVATTQTGINEIKSKSPTPQAVGCLSYDSESGNIFAKGLSNNNFYRYDPVADSWTLIGVTPQNIFGQTTCLEGQIYLGGTQLHVYSIATNSWSAISFPVEMETGNLTNDGQYIYTIVGTTFYRYDPIASMWSLLADPPKPIGANGGLSYHSGVIYAHEDATIGITGDGKTGFYKYFLDSDSWFTSKRIPGKAANGSAIEPAGRRYFVVDAPANGVAEKDQLAILDLTEGEWSALPTPFETSKWTDVVFVGRENYSGIYICEGPEGTGFAYYQTPPAQNWVTITPAKGDLLPGGTQTLNVDLDAQGLDAGVYTGKIRVSSVRPPIENFIPLELTVIGAPDISINRPLVAFGEVLVGKQYGISITIKNTGTASLMVSDVTVEEKDFKISDYSASALPSKIYTGESIIVTALLLPTESRAYAGTFTIHSDDPDEAEIQFVLTGNAVPPPIPGITPSSLTVNLMSGDTATRYVVISNTGGATMDYALDITPRNTWLSGEYFGLLAKGDTKTLPIIIDAKAQTTGSYEGKISLSYHGDLVKEVPITMTVTSAPDIMTSTATVNYGEKYINYQHAESITISNPGVMPLLITNISSDNSAFEIYVEDPADDSNPISITTEHPLTLQPGMDVTAVVQFLPAVIGSYVGEITIDSNDPDEASYVIPMSGAGIYAPVISTGQGQLEATAVVDEATNLTFTLANNGPGILRWRIKDQANPSPSSVANKENTEQPAAPGDFSEIKTYDYRMRSLTVNPATGLVYTQMPYSLQILEYDPTKNDWQSAGLLIDAIDDFDRGGATILNSRMYCVYPEDDKSIYVFDLAIGNWSSIPNALGAPTMNITTDGALLYLTGGGKFKSLDPANQQWTDLPIPPIALDGNGGLSHFDGVIYAHEGTGTGFAKYDIANATWESLVALPDLAGPGSTIDPVRGRYYAYGKEAASTFLYEYDLEAAAWSVLDIPFFEAGDGGLAYVPGVNGDAIYFSQGSKGTAVGRYEPREDPSWMRATPVTGVIAGSDNQIVGINFNAYHLDPGTYNGMIEVLSNDPENATLQFPVTFNVITSPSINVPEKIEGLTERSTPYTTKFKIENKGGEPLAWNINGNLPEGLTVNPVSGIIPALSSTDVELSFQPSASSPSVVEYLLEISSNDPVHSTTSIPLTFTVFDNHPPIVAVPLPDQSLQFLAKTISFAQTFSDVDGDPLTFSASSSHTEFVSVDVMGLSIKLTPVASGVAEITVTAEDSYHASAAISFQTTVDQVTGIEILRNEIELTSDPNPFDKKFTIRYHTRHPGKIKVVLVDSQGKIVATRDDIEELMGPNEIEVDGSELPAGIYACRLLLNQGTRVIRVVKY